MIVYVIIEVETLERIKCCCIIQCSRQRGGIEDREEMCSTEDAVDVNHGQILGATKIVRRHHPHSIIRVGLISRHRKPMNESTLVQLAVNCK